MKNYKLLKFIQITSAVIFITAVICIFQKMYVYHEEQKDYNELSKQAITIKEYGEKIEEIKQDIIESERVIDFNKLKQINNHCIGWVSACDDKINYPIVLSEDVNYYLDHGFNDKDNKAGCFFVHGKENDENVFDGFQTVIYGHNMKDGSMMHEIVSYKSKEYLASHPYITLWTEKGDVYKYEVFASYYMAEDKLPIIFDNRDEQKREEFIKSIEKYCLSIPNVNDNIITLVTCEYSGENYRMVVHAKKV